MIQGFKPHQKYRSVKEKLLWRWRYQHLLPAYQICDNKMQSLLNNFFQNFPPKLKLRYVSGVPASMKHDFITGRNKL
jgi:hypothetical protein